MVSRGLLFLGFFLALGGVVFGVSELISLPGCPGPDEGRRRCEAPPGLVRQFVTGFGAVFGGAGALVASCVVFTRVLEGWPLLGMPTGVLVAAVVAWPSEVGAAFTGLVAVAGVVSVLLAWIMWRTVPVLRANAASR
ncbi:hypothetical protein JNUCC64_26205 [Streptomyces sp. JNUCC 64]